MKRFARDLVRKLGYDVSPYTKVHQEFPIHNPLANNGIEILKNPMFEASCKEIRKFTLLDTPRLANLWMLSQMTDNEGVILEIGSYKGGGAKHLCNANPQRKVFVFDPFDSQSFENLEPSLDKNFFQGQFSDTSYESVKNLLKDTNSEIVRGYFPDSVGNFELPKISFVYLDVDTYNATLNSLLYLHESRLLMDKHILLLDDFNRGCDGVNKAVEEFVKLTNCYFVMPMFPGQGVLLPHTHFASPDDVNY